MHRCYFIQLVLAIYTVSHLSLNPWAAGCWRLGVYKAICPAFWPLLGLCSS